MTSKELSAALHGLMAAIHKIAVNAELVVRDDLEPEARSEAVRVIRNEIADVRMRMQSLKEQL